VKASPGTAPLKVLRTRIGEEQISSGLAALQRELWSTYSPVLAPRSKASVPPGGPAYGAAKPKLDLVLFLDDPLASNRLEAAMAAVNRAPSEVHLTVRPVAFEGSPSERQVGLACAASSGKFAEYVRALPRPSLEIPPRRGPETSVKPVETAVAAGLDRGAFTKCLESDAGRRSLEENTKVASQLGLGPQLRSVLFLNGSALCANVTEGELEALIREDPL
jgi:hypothetical protein